MDAVILIGLGVLLCGWAFARGKREGSQKGFHAGRRRRPRPARRWPPQ